MSTDPLLQPYKSIQKKKKGNSPVIGLLIGIACPLLAIVILYFLWSGNANFRGYLEMFISFDSPLAMSNSSKAVSLAMIANLIPFYYFLNRKQYGTVRGILVSMVIFVALIVLYKFAWQ